jgi:hypothetical protein
MSRVPTCSRPTIVERRLEGPRCLWGGQPSKGWPTLEGEGFRLAIGDGPAGGASVTSPLALTNEIKGVVLPGQPGNVVLLQSPGRWREAIRHGRTTTQLSGFGADGVYLTTQEERGGRTQP